MDEQLTQEYTEYSYGVRGKLLHRVTLFEMVIDTHLTHYFTKDPKKLDELIALVFTPRTSFDHKIQILNYLIEQHYPEFHKKHPKYTKEFKTIVETRNVLAHYPLKLSQKFINNYKKEKSVCFAKFKNTRISNAKNAPFELFGEVTFTEKNIDDFLKCVEGYTKSILDLAV